MASTAGYAMSSPGWETVSRKTNKSKQNTGINAATNASKKKIAEIAPRLEDVLSIEQVASFYAFESEPKQTNLEQRQPKNANKINEEETNNKKNDNKNAKKSTQEPS